MNRYIGKRLDGRYEIRELIGIGGMADVYRAYDVLEQKVVAVKILKEEYLTNEDFKRRFRNESKAIAVLSHPNIVKIFDVSFGDRVQFIVMEYVDGITLKEYIEQQKIVSWKETVHFTVQILRALQHAHDNGIVHRDIKPQNVMLLQDGTVKVMDFGIARFARDNGRTISEKAIGSVHYISPEQARGEVTDERTDIYSVGVMMFEMLTGRLPFDGESPVAVAVKQMQAEAPTPRSINGDIPEGLEEIVIRAMKKDPDLRYQTAAEMLRDIDEFKRNPSVVFEYKYFTDDTSTKYFDAVNADDDNVVVKKRISPVMQILLAVTGAFVIIAIIALVIFFSAINNPNPDTSVPTLIGMKYEDVINDPQITDKFEIIKEKEEMSDEYEAGIITDQTPSPGKPAKEGQKIRVVVSSGLNTATVPDVTKRTEEEALQILKDAGFETKVVAKFDNEVEKGLVTHTDPAANTEAKKSEVIKVYVSTGSASKTVEVPNLLGKSEAAAKEMLTSKNLVCGGTSVVDSDQPKGTVVNQSIAAGTNVGEGTSVQIQVSSGTPKKSTVEIPIKFSGNVENKNFTVVAYLDGVQVGTYSVNPASNNGKWTLSLTEAGNKKLTLQVGGTTFATYQVDFDAGSVNQQGSTNMAPFLKHESSSEPESSGEESSEEDGD